MSLKNLLLVNGVVLVAFALGMLLMPANLLAIFGFTTNMDEKLLGQLVGVELLANGMLSLFALNVRESGARKALSLSFFIADGIGFIVALGGMLSGAMNPLGWIIVLVYLLLAVGFGYFQFVGPSE